MSNKRLTTSESVSMGNPDKMADATSDGAGAVCPQLYADYYASDRERQWYEVCAIEKARNFVEFCASLRPGSVLDVGAGSGAVLERYVRAGVGTRVCAVEISESGLAELEKRRAALLAEGVQSFAEAKRFDGLSIPYADDSFDLAILSHVLEHVEHPRALLHEIRRVARRVYVEVPLEACSLKRNLRGDWVMDSTGHINYFNLHTLRRMMQTAGWRVLREGVSVQNKEPYVFMSGTKGLAQWAIKRAMMVVSPVLSQSLFVFHAGILCERAPLPPVSLGAARVTVGE